MIVLAILGGLLVLGLPRLKFNQNNLKKISRDLMVTVKEVRNQARVSANTQRLVFQLNYNTDPNKTDEYWLESANGVALADPKAEKIQKEKADSDENKTTSAFSKSDKVLKKPKEIPSGFHIVSVETASNQTPVTEGEVHIHFSPQGLIEKSIIQIKGNSEAIWSLVINPLTGRTDIIEKPVTLKDL